MAQGITPLGKWIIWFIQNNYSDKCAQNFLFDSVLSINNCVHYKNVCIRESNPDHWIKSRTRYHCAIAAFAYLTLKEQRSSSEREDEKKCILRGLNLRAELEVRFQMKGLTTRRRQRVRNTWRLWQARLWSRSRTRTEISPTISRKPNLKGLLHKQLRKIKRKKQKKKKRIIAK